MSDQYIISPGGRLGGELTVPGDKSISHRAVMLGALGRGQTTVSNLLTGDDVVATQAAFAQMGVTMHSQAGQQLVIEGVGMHGLQTTPQAIDLGNSGTAFRLLTGLLAGQGKPVTLTGDHSLCSRPMGRVLKPLAMMGAIIAANNGKPPVRIEPQTNLAAIDYTLPIASAQVKSALLLAGLYAHGKTIIREPTPTRDHTERMLSRFGYPFERQGEVIMLKGGGNLNACHVEVPADLSSAAFFIVAALIMPGSEITLHNVGVNPTRTGVISILRKMGATIELHNQRLYGAEPVADIRVGWSELNGCDIANDEIALAIDELPIIAIAAACARGQTVITGAEELRVKESDRIDSVVKGLRNLSIDVDEKADGMLINGGKVSGGVVDSNDDHRIAMAFSIAGAVADAQVRVLACANIATSFPGFLQLAAQAGINIHG